MPLTIHMIHPRVSLSRLLVANSMASGSLRCQFRGESARAARHVVGVAYRCTGEV